MAGKTLSNGTLSLRFMQNAQRAKLQSQVTAEQAKIKDDAEWSVSQELKDAWGIGQSSGSTDDTVHEDSYVPFMSQAETSSGPSSSEPPSKAVLKGRRTFTPRGEVIAEESKDKQDGEDLEEKPDDLEYDDHPRPKRRAMPTSISNFKAPISTRPDGDKKVARKTAQQLIREIAPIDVSTPPDTSRSARPPAPSGTAFMKPEGVDAPVPLPSKLVKRERVESAGSAEGKKKRKKKKDAVS
ncbi:uncharacterized protein BXZ73DRAFT_91871 [Epithele typhae]|uniref:uncharacterized protein n=1 Tax=Epithele typhae TaxID=378194 RepID=UPI002007C3E9|nr:uncharacterized protein BXZ73DRAFT_93367 [Epithele typhae]XP_047874569.1 uncharacterized protein BXZ73DRAFT_91871 [Epithele typhae]KAH9911481.1 hypothetical protein BXZ73DRAFT_93367 [Epithele typhae]KAH9920846.1 hypothetical protein BXZ73DRAFT_91871 [Epithele typhae]